MRLELVVTIIASLTAAGLLSLAFLADKLASTEIAFWTFVEIPDGRNSLAAVMWQLTTGGIGMLVALGLAIWDREKPRGSLGGLLRRWAGGTLAVSATAVVLLFPATIVLILTTPEALTAPTS